MIEMSNAYNISTEEFIVLYMIFLSQIDENDGLGRKELLQLYVQNDNNAETLEKTIQSLKDKNIIKKEWFQWFKFFVQEEALEKQKG